MRKILEAVRRIMKTVMEINEASFPWYAAMVTIIIVFRLFSEDILTKIGISIIAILGFFGTSVALKLTRKAILRVRANRIKGKEEQIRPPRITEKENGKQTLRNTITKAAWIIGGSGVGIFISRNSILKLYALMRGEISEPGAWIVLGGLAICAIAASTETRE